MRVASAPNSTRTHVKVISSTGCSCFSIDGRVEGQYITIYIYIYIYIYMITIVVNGHDDPISNRKRGCLRLIQRQYTWERYESSYGISFYWPNGLMDRVFSYCLEDPGSFPG